MWGLLDLHLASPVFEHCRDGFVSAIAVSLPSHELPGVGKHGLYQ
jgi:hypothetical protein